MASDVPAPARLPIARARQHQNHDGGVSARHRDHQRDGDERAGDRRHRQQPREGADEAEIQDHDGPESRGLGSAENRRIGERIAQQSLQRRAREAENPADHEGQQRAGETNFAHHDAGAAEIHEQCFERARERDRRRTDDERGDGEDREENQEAGNQEGAGHEARFSLPLRGGVGVGVEKS